MFERLAVDCGAVLFDPARVDDPGWQLFDRARWRERGALTAERGGRGNIDFIEDGHRSWALRRYLRGGLPARFARERYLFLGEDRTRSFRELRLLARLRSLGLPVPAPVAAGYRRSAFTYVAEIITERLAGAIPLIDAMHSGGMDGARWDAIGRCLRRFHDAGVQHADLTARNVLVDDAGGVWLLDFDRGRLREPGAWRAGVIERLARSLAKHAAPGHEWRAGFEQLRRAHGC